MNTSCGKKTQKKFPTETLLKYMRPLRKTSKQITVEMAETLLKEISVAPQDQ